MQAAVGGGHPALPPGTPRVTQGGGGTWDRGGSMLLPSLVPACGHSRACNAFIFLGVGAMREFEAMPILRGTSQSIEAGTPVQVAMGRALLALPAMRPCPLVSLSHCHPARCQSCKAPAPTALDRETEAQVKRLASSPTSGCVGGSAQPGSPPGGPHRAPSRSAPLAAGI